MTEEDKKNRNRVFIEYIKSLVNGYKIKAEFSTNDKDKNVIVVQQTSGNRIVFFGNDNPMYTYFNIYIFNESIQKAYEDAIELGELIGHNDVIDFNEEHYDTQKWQVKIKQYSNPRAIEYYDIRKVAYTMTFQCIVNRIQ